MFKELTKHQRFVLIIAWLGWVFDVMEASLFALTKDPMLKQMMGEAAYKLDGAAVGARIHSGMLLGWALGGLIFGIIADRWGRGKTLLLTVFLYCLFTGLTSLCQTPDQVYWARLLTGLGIGGEWAAGAALIAETMPDHFRARAAAFLQTAAAIGSITGVFLNMSLGATDWRFVYLAGILPAILCLVARFRLEGGEKSPKSSDAEVANVEPDARLAPSTVSTNAGGEATTNPFVQLLTTRPYNLHLLIAVLIGVVGITGGGILPFYLPNVIKEALPGASDQVVAHWKNLSMIVLHLGTLAGVLVFPPLTDRYGRKPMFAVFFIASGMMLYLTATQATSLALIFVLPPLTSFFALGLTAGYGLYFPELFSKSFRATGSGIAYNAARILIAPFQLWLGAQVKAQGLGPAIATVASIYVIAIVALIFAPETRGKTLES